MVSNVHKPSICRACLKILETFDEKIYLFGNYTNEMGSKNDDNLKLSDIFQHLTTIAANENDPLPEFICNNCHVLLKEFYEFRQISIAANLELLKHIDNEFGESKPMFNEIAKDKETQSVEIRSGHDDNESDVEVDTELLVFDDDNCRADGKTNNSSDDEESILTVETNSCRTECTDAMNFVRDCTNGKELQKTHGLYECEICEKRCKKRRDIERHIRSHIGLKPYSCPKCSKSYTRKNRLKDHLLVKHSENSEDLTKYICEITADCKKSFLTRSQLGQHKRLEHFNGKEKQKQYSLRRSASICEYCGKKMRTESGLSWHLISCSQNTNKTTKNVQCEFCNRMLPELKMKRHLKIHTEKKCVCTICGKSVRKLERHINYCHTKEMKYPCRTCDKVFYSNDKLKRHINVVHLKQKNHRCTECNRAFATSGTLKDHIKTHSGEKTYNCGTCGKGFIQHHSFKVHLKTHNK